MWDDGDAVVMFQSKCEKPFFAVTLPTADVLGELKDLDKKLGAKGVLLIVNPQWSTEGQVISDLGFGPWKKANEEFIASFDLTYVQRQLRIKGQQVQLLKSYPCPEWQVFAVSPDG